MLLFAAASCVAAGSASLDPTTIEPPPPPADPPPPLPSARRIPLSVVGLGGVGVLAGSLPVCRRAVSGGVERLIRSVRSRAPSASRVAAPSDSDGAQCEGGVCELPSSAEASTDMDGAPADDIGEPLDPFGGTDVFGDDELGSGADGAPDAAAEPSPTDLAAAATAAADAAAAAAAATDAPADDGGGADAAADDAGAVGAAADADAEPAEAAGGEAAPAPSVQTYCQKLTELQEASGADFPAAAQLLSRYCQNAAEVPANPKYRKIRQANAGFTRILGPYSSAIDCLRAVGFVSGEDAEGGKVLVMGTADAALLRAASEETNRRIAVYNGWPDALRAVLPSACRALESRPDLMDELASELSAAHVPQLLDHLDNAERVSSQLFEEAHIERLITHLAELRSNVTAAGAGAPSRVRRVCTQEEWYDVLLEAKGLVVADFGAEWCGACQQVKPLFEELSSRDAYRDVRRRDEHC